MGHQSLARPKLLLISGAFFVLLGHSPNHADELTSKAGEAAQASTTESNVQFPPVSVPQASTAALQESHKEAEAIIREATAVQPQPPVVPPRELQPVSPLSGAGAELSAYLFGSREISPSLLGQVRASRAYGPGTDVVLGVESKARSTSDAGSLLGKSYSVLGVGIQKRTPIVTDTLNRGKHVGQQAGAGSYWFPARQDMDTLLSKLDSRIISDIIVIKGPYSALYGPTFAVYDVELLGSPRYASGFEAHGSTSLDYQTNGQQWYGRQSIWGEASDWGFRVGYGHRTGNDYEAGDGTEMPASYKSRDVDLAFGFDLSEDSYVEFSYLRLDQTDVEFPGQLFDIDFLVTDAFDIKYVLENQCYFDRLTFETWYNRTRFEGDTLASGKRRRIPFLNDFKGFTDVDAMSTGFRLMTTWGQPDCLQLTCGVDLRFLEQELNEDDFTAGQPVLGDKLIPRSHASNPGLFLQAVLPLSDELVVRSGGRADWVSTNAERTADIDGDGMPDDSLEDELGGGFDQNFTLWSAYVTAEYELDCHWTATGGFGYAMRPPTMTELYAFDPFLAVLPQFFRNVLLGDPNLDPERLWQLDLGLNTKWQKFRGGINGFYAWVHDYITLDALNPLGGISYAYVHTDLATLAGGEAYGEYDLNPCMTSFATMSYVEGRDHSRAGNPRFPGFPRSFDPSEEKPLPAIPPLEARVGFRFHEASEHPRWAVELSARINVSVKRMVNPVGNRLWNCPTTGDGAAGNPGKAGITSNSSKGFRSRCVTPEAG